MKTIMAVGAHTGDAQLTSGMLLARHAQQGAIGVSKGNHSLWRILKAEP